MQSASPNPTKTWLITRTKDNIRVTLCVSPNCGQNQLNLTGALVFCLVASVKREDRQTDRLKLYSWPTSNEKAEQVHTNTVMHNQLIIGIRSRNDYYFGSVSSASWDLIHFYVSLFHLVSSVFVCFSLFLPSAKRIKTLLSISNFESASQTEAPTRTWTLIWEKGKRFLIRQFYYHLSWTRISEQRKRKL